MTTLLEVLAIPGLLLVAVVGTAWRWIRGRRSAQELPPPGRGELVWLDAERARRSRRHG